MKRTPFKRPTPPPSSARTKQYQGKGPTPRAAARARAAPAAAIRPAPKERVCKSAAYEAAVRKLPCFGCRTAAVPRQFCHADEGKGTGIKTDVRRGWPGCPACHHHVGSTGKLGKAGRRLFEDEAAAYARAAVAAAGEWPARLPPWESR